MLFWILQDRRADVSICIKLWSRDSPHIQGCGHWQCEGSIINPCKYASKPLRPTPSERERMRMLERQGMISARFSNDSILDKQRGKRWSLFHFEDGTFVTRDRFVSAVREALKIIGIDPSKYSGHSFCRGAATTAQSRGITDVTVKMLRRWKSSAYTRHIQTPRSQLAAFSLQLAYMDS